MAITEPIAALPQGEVSRQLADQWRRLTRAATFVALLTSPAVFVWFHEQNGYGIWKSLLLTFVLIITFRGLVDIGTRRAIPWPSLFGSDSRKLREEDVVNRRRVWFWRFWFRRALWITAIITIIWLFRGGSWLGTIGWLRESAAFLLSQPTLWIQVVFVFFLLIANFAILLGPLLAMNLTQVRGFEPATPNGA